MMNITVTFKEGLEKNYIKGITLLDIIHEHNAPLLAAKLDNVLTDLNTSLENDCTIQLLDFQDSEGSDVLRHSTSHIMAHAVMDLFKDVKFGIGPSIEDGFYYDFDLPEPFTPDDLEKIEKRMKDIIKRNLPFERTVVPKEEAIKIFQEKGQIYKIELIENIPDDTVSIYKLGEFTDLCRGPHIPSLKLAKNFKLLSIAGAYWRGDEKNKMLQRIYGTVYPSKDELSDYIEKIEEAKKRDHRKLGKELDLFSISNEAGAGFVIFHPKGALLRMILEDFEKKEHLKRGYLPVYGPQILKLDLWKKSGHYDHYRENMYFTEIEEQGYGIKPMNCLAHMLIYKAKIRSYRDLPLRYFELGTVHRHEKSGVLHGLTRVRGFTQDDAHILCTPEQLNDEIKGVLNFVIDVMNLFGFSFEMEVSTKPENSIGSDEIWERATAALIQSMKEARIAYKVNEGDGAFYGPKIDVKLKDALNRSWQCATIQCDFTLPERFDLTYIAEDGQRKRPAMLHRVILGSLERFIAILTEHYAGAFPLWLAPTQIKILTITDKHAKYAAKIEKKLKEQEFRVETDMRNEKIGFKIREAQMAKIPYMLVVGDLEVAEETVNVRARHTKKTFSLTIDEFIKSIDKEIRESTQLKN